MWRIDSRSCRILKTGCIYRADSGKSRRRTGRTDQTDRTDNCRYPGEIISYAEDREELKIIGDYYRMRAEKYEVLGTLPQSRRTFIISGYAKKRYRRSRKESGMHMTV